jgi:hypothetical protein
MDTRIAPEGSLLLAAAGPLIELSLIATFTQRFFAR